MISLYPPELTDTAITSEDKPAIVRFFENDEAETVPVHPYILEARIFEEWVDTAAVRPKAVGHRSIRIVRARKFTVQTSPDEFALEESE